MSLGYAIGKITGVKILWNLSFYFKIVHQFKNQGPTLASTHASPPGPLPIWGTPKFPPPLGLVIKTDILWGNRDFFFPFAKNRSTRFKSPYGRFFFLKAKPILPPLKQDKHSLDLYSLLQNSSFQTWEGIMTVQFIALFSPPFWWYFQKKKISQKQMGHLPPQHPKFVLPSRSRKHHQAQHLPHNTSFSGVFTCVKQSLPVLKWVCTKNSGCVNAMWTGRWGWVCTEGEGWLNHQGQFETTLGY